MRRRHPFPVLLIGLAVCFAAGLPVLAASRRQESPPEQKELFKPTISSGQPARTHWGLGATGGLIQNSGKSAFQFFLKMSQSLALKPLSLLSWEGTAGMEKMGGQTSLSLGGFVNLRWLSIGARYRPQYDERRIVPVIAVENALGRGGTFGLRMAELRAEWSPGVFSIGLTLNFNEQSGQNRPKRTYVNIPKGKAPPIPGVETCLIDTEALTKLKHAVSWIDRFTTPAISKECLAELKEHIKATGHYLEDEDRLYHDSLDQAVMTALADSIPDPQKRAGEAQNIAERAEKTIFENIIVPFNRLLGQRKRPMTISGLARQACDIFGDYIDHRQDPSQEKPAADRALKEVFRRLTQFIDLSLQGSRYRWMDDRLAEFLVKELGMRNAQTSIFNWGMLCWIPLNYGLRPSQYDTQTELDGILGLILGELLTAHNKISYLINEQWHHELLKTIRDTRYYHVLIIHDYSGVNKEGLPDKITWEITLDGYGEAILKGIDDYLAGRRDGLPHFSVFLDQFYYEFRGSRKPLTFLETLYKLKPLQFKPAKRADELSRRVRDFQKRLRTSLARLKAERGWTQEDIKRQVKVHINITNKASETFGAYALHDDIMRDHRKVAFRDVFEDAPCWGSAAGENGVAIFTGQGIGEHYLGASWEDRSLKVEGVDLVKLKTAARELFLSQSPRYGMREVPYYLRPRPYLENHEAVLRDMMERGFRSRLTAVMNMTGYAPKTASVLKAALYNLIPKGGTIIAPDPQWSSDFWLGMFVGASLRGVNTYLVGASVLNTPSEAPVVRGAMHNALVRGMIIADEFKEELAKSGGSLNIGLFHSSADATHLEERIEQTIHGFMTNDRLNGMLQVHPGVLTLLKQIREDLAGKYQDVHAPLVIDAEGDRPRLHLKAQFFASKTGMEILKLDEWEPVLKSYFEERIRQTTGHPLTSAGITPGLFSSEGGSGSPGLIEAFERYLPPEERAQALFFLTLGSHNQNRRSMFLDGEALVAVAGTDSLIALMDIIFLLHSSVWPKDVAEFKSYLPESIDIGGLFKDLF